MMAASSSLAGLRDEAWHDEQGRFAIGFAITSGVLISEQQGSVVNGANITPPPPCPAFGPPCAFNNPRSTWIAPTPFSLDGLGSTNAISPNIGANLELMAPALDFLPAKPRVFATMEILPTYAGTLTVARAGAASELRVPVGIENFFFPEAAIEGSGSRVDAEVMTTVLAANVGAAMAFEYRGRVLRIKPSAGWIRWGVIATGRSLDGYKNDPVVPQIQEPLYGSYVRLVEVNGRGSSFFNAVGPGLELEMEVDRRGDFRPVLFASAFAYHTVGEDTITFQGSSPVIFDPIGLAQYRSSFTFQVDDWSYRASLGFRLRWIGF